MLGELIANMLLGCSLLMAAGWIRDSLGGRGQLDTSVRVIDRPP
jgi:hypothetical protein